MFVSGSRDAVKEILESMANIGVGGIYDVSRSGPDNVNGFTWQVTFADHMRNVPPLYLYSSSLTGTGADIAVQVLTEGNILGGYFTLEYDGYRTTAISHDASADEMKDALEELQSLGSVVVTRTDTYVTDQGGYAWSVSFTDRMNSKNLKLMTSTWEDLSGVGSSVVIEEVQAGSELSGSFKVRLGATGTWGSPIAHDASAEDVKHVLEALPEVKGSLDVNRSAEDDQGGYVWTVRFMSPQDEGDIADFGIDYSALGAAGAGVGSLVHFNEERKGSKKEIQVLSVLKNGLLSVSAATFFKLTVTDSGGRTATTGSIPANSGGVCDSAVNSHHRNQSMPCRLGLFHSFFLLHATNMAS
jgi:hypothetical protein